MSNALTAFIAGELRVPLPAVLAEAAERIGKQLGGAAVLFYGSNLRTGDLDGVLDFYVLTHDRRAAGWAAVATGWLWPDVSFHELRVGDHLLHAKVATMRLETFERAARGATLDTTVWTRFVQPVALAFATDAAIAARVVSAVASAACTAARFAAAVGPVRGSASDYWLALFRETYAAELRVEPPGRENQILAYHPGRYGALLPLAWAADGIAFEHRDSTLTPKLSTAQCTKITQSWLLRAHLGKALNILRLIKATTSFEGAARYALWKIERHTGVRVPLTPWRERHPLLAAPNVLWRVFRTPSH